MKLRGGRRDGEVVTLKDGSGKDQILLPGFVLNYHYGLPKDGQTQVNLSLASPDPARELYASIPGVFETYVLREDGDFHLVPPVVVKPA